MQRDAQRDRGDPDAQPSTVDADVNVDVDANGDPDGRLVDMETELVDDDAHASADAAPDADAASDESGGLWSRLPVPSVSAPVSFSPKAFGVLTVVMLVGLLLGAAVPILGGVPVVGGALRFLGLFVVAFGTGLVASRRRYAEVGLAAALASGLAFVPAVARPFVRVLAEVLGSADVATTGLLVTGVGAGTGLLVALAGYYFGRDLRDGLTRDV